MARDAGEAEAVPEANSVTAYDRAGQGQILRIEWDIRADGHRLTMASI